MSKLEIIRKIYKHLESVTKYSDSSTYFFKLEKICGILCTNFNLSLFDCLKEESSIYKKSQVGSFEEALELFNKRFKEVVDLLFNFLTKKDALEEEEDLFLEVKRELLLLLHRFPRKAFFVK